MSGTDLETLAASPRPVWLWDPDRRRVVRANRAAVAFFGEESLLDLVERPFDPREPGVAALADPDLRNAGEAAAEKGGAELALDFPSVADGPLKVRVAPHGLPDGRTGLLVVALEPLPPERLGQPGLLREVLEAMPLPVVALDASARPVYANPAAREMFDDAQLSGMSALFDDVHDALKFLERAARAGLAVTTRHALTRTGERDIRVTARLAESGGPDGRIFTVILEDVTERRLLEKALERGGVPGLDGVSARPRTEMTPAVGMPVETQAETGRGILSEADVEAFRRLSSRPDADDAKSPEGAVGKADRKKGETATEERPAPARDAAPIESSSGKGPEEEATPAGSPAAEDAEREREGTARKKGKEEGERRPVVVIRSGGGERTPAAETGEKPPSRKPSGEEGASVAERTAEGEPPMEKTRSQEPAEEGTAKAGGSGTRKPRARGTERPETPRLVRDVLDHRREPILLHRGGTFYYANRAARETFGFDGDSDEWDRLAARLLEARDGGDVRLKDARGKVRAFTLKRDVFPWRDGAVVQSTLHPVETEDDAPDGEREEDAPGSVERKDAGTTGRTDGKEAAASRSGRTTVLRIGGAAAKGDAEEGRAATGERGRSGETAKRAAAPVVRIDVRAGGGDDAATARGEERAGEPAAEPAPSCDTGAVDEELRAILDTATDGIITLNRQGEILSFSAGAEALFGVPLKEVVGRPFRELLDERSRRVLDDYLDVLATGGEMAAIYNEGREVTARVAGGGTIPLFLTIGRLGRRGDVDRPNKAAFCVVVRDITQWKKTESELRRAKERAERSSAQKSRFLAAISHELRTPLNAILGFSDVMRQQRFGEIGNEKYLGYANDIHESGEHLLSLINDLLDLSKIEAGKFELTFEAVDLASIATDCLNLMEEQASRGQVLLRRSIPDGLPKVVADARSMKQIFLNLLSNAVKFTPPGGQVMLSLKLTGAGELVAAVSDTGPGMTEEERELALKPFQRLSGEGREERPGTGLGLPLTKALAEANKARFELASTPGKGTTARIIFPTPRVLAG